MLLKKVKEMICEKNKCTGCGACANVCPMKCITMKYSEEGFLYPEVDESKCKKCSKCIKTCPSNKNQINNNKLKKVYACWNNQENIIKNSSSGGMFPIFAEYFISNGGKVVGSTMDSELNVKFIMIDKLDDIRLLTGSKYIQSKTGNIYNKIKKSLVSGEKILFIGCPCQVAALNAILSEKEKENLLTIDLVCHGAGSKKFFDNHIKEIEEKYNDKIINVKFKCKKRGWLWYIAKYEFESGKVKYKYSFNDAYMTSYLNLAIYRESCYQCKYASIPRIGDITLGDFYGIDRNLVTKKELKNGISLLTINNNKGQEYFNKIKSKITYIERPVEETITTNKNISTPSKRPKCRDDILKENLVPSKLAKKYCKYKFISKIIMYVGSSNKLIYKIIKMKGKK